MKYLSIVLAILILGCGTDTEVIEEPPPVDEEPTPVPEETLPAAEEPPLTVEDKDEDRSPPNIVRSDVLPKEPGAAPVPLNPVPLNQDGIFFEFDEDLGLFKADLLLDGESLKWSPRVALTGDDIGSCTRMKRTAESTPLEYDKEYHINISFRDNERLGHDTTIKFRTIPRP